MFERISGFALMALFAPNGLMHPFKSEVCFVVVKIACPPFDCKERDFSVALATVLSELILVRVFMTIGAIAEEDTPELLEILSANSRLFMTFNTGHTLVAAQELELCSRMIKL
jgi:hypothetical protein